jgi:hypothetical protein
MDTVVRQLRLALRQLMAAPGFSLAAILALSLASGAATAIFSAVYAVLLSPMSVRDPQALVIGWGRDPERTEGVVELSYLDVADLGRASRHLVNTAAVGSHAWNAVLDGVSEPTRLCARGLPGRRVGPRALGGTHRSNRHPAAVRGTGTVTFRHRDCPQNVTVPVPVTTRYDRYDGVRSISSSARTPVRIPSQNVVTLTTPAVMKQEYMITALEVRIGSTRSCCAR